MRAAILTIALILAAVLFGGLIPQGLPPEAYLELNEMAADLNNMAEGLIASIE